MGMDIYGLDPKIVGERPELDFSNATDQEKQEFFKAMNEWEDANPGSYFRANIWSWRPINMLINHVNKFYNLGIDTTGFDYNSGHGVQDQETCDRLADTLEYILESDEDMQEEDDQIFFSFGMWVNDEGSLLTHAENEELNSEYEIGKIMYTPVVTATGKVVKPAYSTSKSHLEEFINFLRHCGGFEIW